MRRTMIENDLNLGGDAASAAVAMAGIAIAAQRRPHLMESITLLGWLPVETDDSGEPKGHAIYAGTKDAGTAVHLANALGLPAGRGQAAFTLPRIGNVNGIPVMVQVHDGVSNDAA